MTVSRDEKLNLNVLSDSDSKKASKLENLYSQKVPTWLS